MSERQSQLLGWAIVPAILVALCVVAPALAGGGPIFVSPGGAYSGVVGKPVQMNAGASVSEDGGEIKGYYWDWFGNGMCECSTLPKCEFTWHSAYSGTIVLQIWDEHDDLGVGETPIVVTGPENILTATLQSNADLHVYGPRGCHTGLSSNSGVLKTQLPGSSCLVLDAEGSQVPVSGQRAQEELAQVIRWPLYLAGTYRVQAVGTGDSSFDLTICATQDGTRAAEKTISGAICQGETVTVNVTGSCANGKLQIAFDEPVYSPGVVIEPSEIKLVVEAGKTYEVPLTIREAFFRTPLSAVTLSNEDIAGPVNKVNAGAVGFAPNSFDLEPGGEKTVVATIPVPMAFLGKATGKIVVRSANGAAATVNVTVKTAGSCPPHCNGIGPVVGLVGEPVTFDASGSYDPDGEILQYGWDWDDDGDFEWTTEPTITHTWDAPFTGTVRLIVFDDNDECADTYVDVTITNP